MVAQQGDALAPDGTIPRARVADQIIDALRRRILTGSLPRDSRLPTERELAAEFGVSAPTIRESLRALTSLGLVEVRHGSGAYVRTDSDAILSGPLAMLMQLESVGMDEVVGLIQVLNLHAARLAADSATESDIAAVRAAAERTAHCETLEDAQRGGAAFLVALSDASHQPLLAGLCRFLINLLVTLETSVYIRKNVSSWRRWTEDTASTRLAIADALARRDQQALHDKMTELHDRVLGRLSPKLLTARISDPALAPFVGGIGFDSTRKASSAT